MTSLLAPAQTGSLDGRPSLLGRPSRRMRRSWTLVGVLLVVGSALLFALLASATAHHSEVLVVARPVSSGQTLSAADLRVARVSADRSLASVPASELARVVGRTAAVDLRPATLLVRSELASSESPGPTLAVVGVALKAGQAPAHLRAGDRVMVLRTSAPAQAGTGSEDAASVLERSAAVVAVEAVSDAAGTVVCSVAVPPDDAPSIAEAASAGRISLVSLGAGA